ncbi:MAG TPA: hypothetical protein VMY98_05770 [Anaerolineae bacterium]|nr:hypothetical protein [Anaerolineae bacterium]
MRDVRPTVNTRFHIDFSWWDRQNKDIRVFMRDMLCAECRDAVGSLSDTRVVDMIDPETAEVTEVGAIWECIRACCRTKPEYITADTPILDGIFRTFLANGNKSLSVLELYERLGKGPPEMILRMLTKGRIYMGIKPAR